MEILFQATGSTAGFETWLKSFKEISDSLLIEIDLSAQQFVAKATTKGKDIIKYGKLDFSAAGYEVSSVKGKDQKKQTIEEWNAENLEAGRIYFPILDQLDKFIKVVGIFKNSENYKLTVKYAEKDGILLVSKAEFKSLALTMYVGSSEISEFAEVMEKLTDEKFRDRVAAVQDPMVFSVDAEALKMLIVASNVYSEDANKDVLVFETKKDGDNWVLYCSDHGNSTYSYKLAYMNQECENPTETKLPIIKANLITAVKNDADSCVFTLQALSGAIGKKIRIDSGSMFTTIIASVVIE